MWELYLLTFGQGKKKNVCLVHKRGIAASSDCCIKDFALIWQHI
jgi:hypothetical protein